MGLVPGGPGALHALGPAAPGQALEGQHPHALVRGAGDDLGAEAGGPQGVVHGEQDGVEGEAVHRRQGRLDAVGGEPEEAHGAGLAGLPQGLDGAAGAEGGLHVVAGAQGVELVEVEAVGAQAAQGGGQLGTGLSRGALVGLAGQETAVPPGFQGGAQEVLGVAVGGGRVDVVDAALEGAVHHAPGLGLAAAAHGDAAEADDGDRDAGGAQGPAGHAAGVRPAAAGAEAESGGGGHPQEVAPIHGRKPHPARGGCQAERARRATCGPRAPRLFFAA